MAIFWNYIMSMYDEFEIQKLLLLLQKLASKKENTSKPPPAHPKREWAALDTYKNGGLCCGRRIQQLWGQVYGAQVKLSHEKQ